MEQRQCRLCLNSFDATTDHFYMTSDGYMTRQCKRCKNADSIERTRQRRRLMREGGLIIPKVTPVHARGTPAYADYQMKLKRLQARLYRARKQGREQHIARLLNWRQTLQTAWYGSLGYTGVK
jgi:hypothetical protein